MGLLELGLHLWILQPPLRIRFTPDVGQCATAVNMTIAVNPNVTPTFTQIPAICSGGALSDLLTTSNNGITGTWSRLWILQPPLRIVLLQMQANVLQP